MGDATTDLSIDDRNAMDGRSTVMQTITPFLWFEDQAEEAANFYVSVFNGRGRAASEGSEVLNVSRYGDAGPGTPGSAMTASFRLEGQEFTALNGGPHHAFTEAISFFVSCETQDEVDYLWTALTEGGEEQPCGWLKDRVRPVLADHPERLDGAAR